MSYLFALSSGPGSSQGNTGPGSSQGNTGPGSSQGNSSPGASLGNSSTGSSQESSNIEEGSSDRMSDQEYFVTMRKFKNLLKKTDRKDKKRRPTYFNRDFNKADDSSSEDERLEDHQMLREIESCQKMRVKILLELYKHIDETPLDVWHTSKHEKSHEGDKTFK